MRLGEEVLSKLLVRHKINNELWCHLFRIIFDG